MARRKSRNRSKADEPEAGGSLSPAGQGVIIPSSAHQDTSMGVGNITRAFDVTDGITGPSFVFRLVSPFEAFISGWSLLENDPSDQDFAQFYAAAVSAGTEFFPITPYARAWNAEMGPVYNRLFQASLTSYVAPPIYDVARYFAVLMQSYCYLYSVMVINKLAYHTDWSGIFPYTGKVPKAIYDIASTVGADDITIAQEYISYMRILERHTLPPWITAEIKRMLTPVKSLDLGGHIMIPSYIAATTSKSNILYALGQLELQYEVELADVRRVVQAYIPYPLDRQMMYDVSDPVSDPLRLSGWYNSGNISTDPFGDTGDPVTFKGMVIDEADGTYPGACLHYTMQGSPTWSEVKMATIFYLTDDPVDDEFWLMTPHNYGPIYFYDENLSSTLLDGTTVAKSDAAFELANFAYNRFAYNDSDVNRGMQMPGYVSSVIDSEAITTMMSIEVLDNWHYDEMATMASFAMGSNYRLRRRELQQLQSPMR
jgi:hypothetical protein